MCNREIMTTEMMRMMCMMRIITNKIKNNREMRTTFNINSKELLFILALLTVDIITPLYKTKMADGSSLMMKKLPSLTSSLYKRKHSVPEMVNM